MVCHSVQITGVSQIQPPVSGVNFSNNKWILQVSGWTWGKLNITQPLKPLNY